MTFHVPDMSGWSEAKRGEWYYQNRAHVDEIFSGDTVTFVFDPDLTLTTREVPMTLREAKIFDRKQEYAYQHHG
jgi:hypothetical protein